MPTLARRLGGALAAVTSALALAVLPGALSSSASAAVCSDPVGTPGDIPALTVSRRDYPLTGGLYMQTNATVSRNTGGVDATTHTFNTYWGIGYTGGALIVLRNGCGDLIGVTQPVQFGVAAKGEFWSINDRYDFWQKPLPAEVTQYAASAEIVHSRVSNSRDMYDKYNEFRDRACQVWDATVGTPCKLPRL
jgi:opacity protein-like surface antigen